jgi:SAM-dependent methyltransferase
MVPKIGVISLHALLTLCVLACQPRADSGKAGSNADPTQVAPQNSSPRKPGIAEDYLNTNRVIWQKPDLVLEIIGDLSEKTVADIGAGTGFFSLRLAPLSKKVIAIDIDQGFVSFLDSVKVRELPPDLHARLETRLALPDNPKLKPGEADIIIIVNTYIYLKNRVAYLETLKNGLSPGGKLLIIDFKKKRMPLGPPQDIRVPLFQTEEELYQAGYRNIVTNDTSLDYQYIITAQK